MNPSQINCCGLKMTFHLYLLLILFLAIGGVSAESGFPRAVWIWGKDASLLLSDPVFRVRSLRFLSDKNVTTIYLHAGDLSKDNVLGEKSIRYRTLITRMHRLGFTVYALIGSAPLKTHEFILPENRREVLDLFAGILKYNDTDEPMAWFDGINIDIEPYRLKDWKKRRDLRAVQYLDLSAEFMAMKEQSGCLIPVGPAIPFWFDSFDIEWNGQAKPFHRHVQDIYDYVAIMDYRDAAGGRDGIICHALNEMMYAEQKGRTVIIGVETKHSETGKITFFDENEARLEEELGWVEKTFSRYRAFGGFAIHHLTTYRDLVNRSKED